MPTLIFCQDSKNATEIRQTYLQAHFDYIETILDQISIAGPLKADTDPIDFDNIGRLAKQVPTQVNGSCFIYSTDDLQEARTLFFNDPYYINGVYQSYTVSGFVAAAGDWINGKVW